MLAQGWITPHKSRSVDLSRRLPTREELATNCRRAKTTITAVHAKHAESCLELVTKSLGTPWGLLANWSTLRDE
jgi:hypothetical protein